MIKLKKSHHDVYYFYDYIPKRLWGSEEDKQSIKISQMILRFKDGGYNEVDFFSRKLAKAIVLLVNDCLDDKFTKLALISVPPSKVKKYLPVKDSIGKIIGLFRKTPDLIM